MNTSKYVEEPGGKRDLWITIGKAHVCFTIEPIRSKKVTLAGMSKIGYRDVYVLDLQPAAGTVERLYLDAQTYLPVRSNTVVKIGTMSDSVEMYFDNWKEVDGIKYPFFISQKLPKLTLAYTVKEIRHNIPIDASIFAR